jgi:hypothetical protein
MAMKRIVFCTFGIAGGHLSQKPFRRFEMELGLPPAPNPLFWGHSPHLTLGLFSPLPAAPQPDWPASAYAPGFPFFDQGQALSTELQHFLEAGEPLIVFTLGSAAVGVAGDFFQQSAEAANRLGRRALLRPCGAAYPAGGSSERAPRPLRRPGGRARATSAPVGQELYRTRA